MFLHGQSSRRERSVLVLIFQYVLLTFSFQGKGGDPRRVVFFVGQVYVVDLTFQCLINGFQSDSGTELDEFTWFGFLDLLLLLFLAGIPSLVESGILGRRNIIQRIIDYDITCSLFLLLLWGCGFDHLTQMIF